MESLGVCVCVCVQGDRQTVTYPPFQPHMAWMNTRGSILTLLTCPEQGGRKRDPYETELSDILLSFIECEAKQEWRTAVSSQTQREADEEQKRERGREEGERERGRERALRSVIFTDVAAALGQTLPVFCVHLRLVSPVLL